jgi:lysophospholipase L1-like esterase
MRGIMGSLVRWYGEALDQVSKSQVYVLNKPLFTKEAYERYSQIEAKPSDFFSDGVHPSELAYSLWAKVTCDQLLEREEIRKELQKLAEE